MMKKTIVFDFDGVIHKGYDGWKDGLIYGQIEYKLLDFMVELMDKYYIVISSCRPAEQIVNFMNDLKYKDLVFEQYDSLYWQKDNIVGVTNRKAVGILYIDDRAWQYQNDFSAEINIKMIKANLKEV